MLSSIEEQDKKLELFIGGTPHIWGKDEDKIILLAKQYAKWYAEQVINHCAEVAKAEMSLAVEGENPIYVSNYEAIVDKQSILNIIDELR